MTVLDPQGPRRPVVLGSASPRRREILESLGIPHEVVVVPVDESVAEGESVDAYLTRVVRAKLEAVLEALSTEQRSRAAAVVVADTTVVSVRRRGEGPGAGERILGKPSGLDEAAAMIRLLSGTTHEVHTRFAVAATDAPGAPHEETVRTLVTFRPLSDARIAAYAATGEGLDKAGAYAIQGKGGALVERIEGSYSCVVGLPACELSVALERLGIA